MQSKYRQDNSLLARSIYPLFIIAWVASTIWMLQLGWHVMLTVAVSWLLSLLVFVVGFFLLAGIVILSRKTRLIYICPRWYQAILYRSLRRYFESSRSDAHPLIKVRWAAFSVELDSAFEQNGLAGAEQALKGYLIEEEEYVRSVFVD